MDLFLALTGLAKLLFGVTVAAVGITTAARLLKRLIGLTDIDTAIRDGNLAVGTALAAAIVAMGLLVQPAVQATFVAFDLLQHTATSAADTLWVFVYAVGMVLTSLIAGAVIIAVSLRAAVRLTPAIDEVEEIRRGNTACAMVLAAITIVLALVAKEGLDTMLNGFLPLPTLGRDFPN